jgi:hypothetical protein
MELQTIDGPSKVITASGSILMVQTYLGLFGLVLWVSHGGCDLL